MLSSMNGGEFWFVLMNVGLVFAVLSRVFAHKRRTLELKHETYRVMLESGQLDRQTLDQIISSIEGRPVPVRRNWSGFGSGIFARASFLVGWLSIFVGLGLLVGGQMSRERDMVTAGFIVGLVGIGLASLPLAWREVQAKAAPEAERRS